MSRDIKLSKAQLPKIQSGGVIRNMLGRLVNLGKKVITDLTIPVAIYILAGLVSNLASNVTSCVINKFERKISGKGPTRARKEF